MKGKSVFSRAEADAIISLIKKKLASDSVEQKRVRDKIRALGFYASDFGIGGGYNEKDFLRVVKIIENGPLSRPKIESLAPSDYTPQLIVQSENKRSQSDEGYIIDLCDEILKSKALRQHRFSFLKGDTGTPLPVDAYYPEYNLVIEFREKQHTEEVRFFDKRQTVSGVTRGEQRKIYDQRRRDLLPQHGIVLIEFDYKEFDYDNKKKLLRSREKDSMIVRKKLKTYLK